MRRRLSLLILCLAAAIFSTNTPAVGSDGLTIVAFGDSTTAPRGDLAIYAGLLEKGLRDKEIPVQVVNAGVGSNHTELAEARFKKDVLAYGPALVIIQFGINDASADVWRTPPATTPRVPLETYTQHLRNFVRTLKEQDATVVLMTPNPLRWTPRLKELYGKSPYNAEAEDGFNVFLKDYAAAVRQIAKQEQVSLLDVYADFETFGRAPEQSVDDLLLDGMHPNAVGHKRIADQLLTLVEKPLRDRLQSGKTGSSKAAGHLGSSGIWLERRVTDLPDMKMGPFVRLEDNRLLTVDGENVCTSSNEGKTWETRPLLPDGPKLHVSNERALLRTPSGTIVLVCMNLADNRKWRWIKETNAPIPDAELNVWAVRSLDDGKTWIDAQRIMQGYCGAIRDMIITKTGRIVVPAQPLLHDKARHATRPYVSDDEGHTWKSGQLLDIGGRGHHDGSVEATLTELRDGRLWMLLRSNFDHFLSTYSDDGLTWTKMQPSGIAASSAPAMLRRLQSGRLLLVWNQLYPEGETSYERRGGQYSQREASWHREELSIAFSDDDGDSWTAPVVVARKPKTWVSYPYVFERRPGEIWLTTMQGGLRCKFMEADFVTSRED